MTTTMATEMKKWRTPPPSPLLQSPTLSSLGPTPTQHPSPPNHPRTSTLGMPSTAAPEPAPAPVPLHRPLPRSLPPLLDLNCITITIPASHLSIPTSHPQFSFLPALPPRPLPSPPPVPPHLPSPETRITKPPRRC